MPKNIKFDAFANRVLKNDVQLMLSRRTTTKEGISALQLGPAGSAYKTLLHQGKIKEVEPFVVS